MKELREFNFNCNPIINIDSTVQNFLNKLNE